MIRNEKRVSFLVLISSENTKISNQKPETPMPVVLVVIRTPLSTLQPCLTFAYHAIMPPLQRQNTFYSSISMQTSVEKGLRSDPALLFSQKKKVQVNRTFFYRVDDADDDVKAVTS